MYLKVLIIDYLSPDGVLTTYRAFPRSEGSPVVIDRLADVRGRPFGSTDKDIGGARIYNSDKVEIVRSSTQLRSFTINEQTRRFEFVIEHMGLPVGFSKNGEGGMYYFIGPFGFRATKLFVSDPYDKRGSDDYARKQFSYGLSWDTRFSSQMIEMNLRSSRGTFSFRVGGEFAFVGEDNQSVQFVRSDEAESVIKRAVEDWHLQDGGKAIKKDLADKVDWVEMKPNLFGIGININKIVKDFIAYVRGDTGRAS